MSIRKGSRTIASSVPVTEWGSVDGTLADQVDLKSALDSKAPLYSPTFTGTPIAPTAPVDASNNQIATTKFVQDALLNAEANLPEQEGNAGKFLSTNGSIPSWESITGLPSQTSQSGKFLTTNGTTASWGTIDLSGKVDKVTTTSSKNRFYIITPAGAQSILEGEQTGQTAATVPIRTSSGTIRTATPSDNNDAATKQYVDDNAVKKTGDETINGIKTFVGHNPVLLKCNDSLFSNTQHSTYLKFEDSEDRVTGWVESLLDHDGSNYSQGVVTTRLWARTYQSNESETDVNSSIDIIIKPDGTKYATAPTPSSVTDNTTKIATTEWVIDVLEAIYPVGSLYIGTQNSCPLSAFFGTWTLVSAGNALWTGNGTSGTGTTANANYANAAANTTIAAGLPNITGNIYGDGFNGTESIYWQSDNLALRTSKRTVSGGVYAQYGASKNASLQSQIILNASYSNSIYGSSTTVQPPAYVVNVWRRTA